jgi:hypothetical protein
MNCALADTDADALRGVGGSRAVRSMSSARAARQSMASGAASGVVATQGRCSRGAGAAAAAPASARVGPFDCVASRGLAGRPGPATRRRVFPVALFIAGSAPPRAHLLLPARCRGAQPREPTARLSSTPE